MKKRILAILMALCMVMTVMPTALAAEGGVDPTKTGYKYNDKYETLPKEPIIDDKSDTITVTPDNAQYTLDGAYGSISGMTIVFSAGTYDQLVLGRATKYPGSDTEYYIGGFDADKKHDYAEFVKLKNAPGHSEYAYYIRNMEDVTLRAEAGATVTIAGMVGVAGHAYGTGGVEAYDYVLERYSQDTNNGYFLAQNWSNITFENLSFTAQVNIESSQTKAEIHDVTFNNCSFTTGGIASGNGAALRYYKEKESGDISGLTVTNCEFDTCFQGIYSSNIKDITVTESTFTNTGHNAVAIQSNGDESNPKNPVNHGAVVITGNTFDGIGNRIIRFGYVADGTMITLTGNTATNSGDGDGEVIKAESLPQTLQSTVYGNDWGEGKFSANDQLKDPETIPATGVTLDKTTLSLVEGDTATLTATVEPADTTDTTVTWSTSDESVATVDQNGVVTAVSEGTATITVTTADGGFSDTCAVTVEARAVTVTFENADVEPITVLPGETITLPTPDDTRDAIFRYWTVAGDPIGTRYYGGEEFTPDEDVTFVANWKDNSYIPIPPTQPTRPTKPTEPDEPDEPDETEEPVESELPFTDVDVDDDFYEAVKYVSENGLMTGVDTTAFAPYNEFTRAQVATVLYRLEKEPAVEFAATFPDVQENQWFAKAVLWGNSKGILLGHDTGKFGPDDGVTFEQMLTILYRYAALKGYDTAARTDVTGYDCSDYAAEAVSWAAAHGMVSAADGAVLKAPAARCQVAQVLSTFCQTVVMK